MSASLVSASPPASRLLVSFALFLAAFTPAVFVMIGSFDGGRVPLHEAVALAAEGVAYSVLMTIFTRVVRRRRNDFDLVQAQSRAIGRRRLPDDAEPDVWLPLMSRRLVGGRGQRWGTIGYAVLLTFLSVLCFVLGHQWWWLLFAAYFVVGGILVSAAARRRYRTTELLVDELVLRSRGDETPPFGQPCSPAAP